MSLGSSVKHSVREQLELQFDTYLGQVVAYLKDSYRELGFSAELVEELAATVIVRVSHSNPEPENLEQALFASADDVVRARRPRLSQQKMVERVTGPLRSELPASLPSLRLIQRLSRVPASNTDDVVTNDSLESLGRLSLPKPPVDLQASLNTMDFNGAKELEGASIPSAAIPSLKHEPRFQPVIPSYDDSLEEITSLREKPKLHEPGELERELDEQLTGTILIPKIQFLSEEHEDPADRAPVGMRQPSIMAENEAVEFKAESSKAILELPAGVFEAPMLPIEATMAGAQAEPAVSAPPPSQSSIPPTKESIVPSALAEMPGLFGEPAAQAKPKATNAPKAKQSKHPSKTSEHKAAPVKARPTGATTSKTKATVKTKTTKKQALVASPEQATQSFGILPDELSMLSMVGFPDNPRRAARLCVASLADELGISSNDGFQSLAQVVASALEELQRGFEASGHAGSHAALQWQRVARQATLRAFLNR